MDNKPRKHDDDDGRRIADMSGVTRPNLWSFRSPATAPWHERERQKQVEEEKTASSQQRPQDQLSKQDRRAYILAAVGAGLAIAAVFGIVFAIAIILIGHVHIVK